MAQYDAVILANPEVAQSVFEKRFTNRGKDDCWLWRGGCFAHRGGYGSFTCRPLGVFMVRAHRASWMIYKREAIPFGRHVLHKCDTPKCVNPSHLFLGDQASNMADKTHKGRQNRGESHGKAKLTEAAVMAIRADTRLLREIAAEHSISLPTVCDIQKRRSWTHL